MSKDRKINLIGISGNIGSGKDTVAKIIQILCNKDDDWFHKNPVEALLTWNGNYDAISDWENKKFAGKLKQIASILTGISIRQFEDQEFKKTFLSEEWDRVYTKVLSDEEYTVQMTVREFLQRLGTDALRDNVHPDIWVNSLFVDFKPPKMSEYNPSNWIISDLRFPNEAQAIKDKGGICIRVIRGVEKAPNPDLYHVSETSLDDYSFDFIIYNNNSIEDLIEEVRKMLQYFKIYERD